MVRVKLKGVAKVTAKGRTYWYAWRGGPRLRGEPGSPAFIASYQEAYENRRTLDTGRFRSLVTLYQCQQRLQGTGAIDPSETGRHGWTGSPIILGSCASLNSTGRRKSGPSSADGATNAQTTRARPTMACRFYAACCPTPSTLSASLASNPCEGIKQLYSGDRSEIIWTDTDIASIKRTLFSGNCPCRRPCGLYRIAP